MASFVKIGKTHSLYHGVSLLSDKKLRKNFDFSWAILMSFLLILKFEWNLFSNYHAQDVESLNLMRLYSFENIPSHKEQSLSRLHG
jgi:hypothetical protein